MKTYGKVILLVAAVMLIVPAAALAKRYANEPARMVCAEDKGMMRMAEKHGGPHHMPFMDCEEFREEMKRHRKAMAEIMEPVKKLHMELAAEIKKLREEYFPKPKEDEKRERPDPEKVKEFSLKVRELVKKNQDDNEDTLKEIMGKAIDERITHHENLIKIAKEKKDEIIEKNWRKILPRRRFHERMRHFLRRHRRWHKRNEPVPEPEEEPAEE